MHISIAKYDGTEDLFTIKISSDLTIRDLKHVIASESNFGIRADEMSLYFEGKLIHFYHNYKFHSIPGKLLDDENQKLKRTNIRDYDVVTCQRIPCMSFLSNFYSTLIYKTIDTRKLIVEKQIK